MRIFWEHLRWLLLNCLVACSRAWWSWWYYIKSAIKHCIKLIFSKLFPPSLYFVLSHHQFAIYKINRPKCTIKKDVLKSFAKFTGKHLCQSLFFNKVAGLGLFYSTTPGDCFCIWLINYRLFSFLLVFKFVIICRIEKKQKFRHVKK